jgi:hypothetical protein
MDEGKNPNPRIYRKDEAFELTEEHVNFIDQLTDELQDGDPITEAMTEKLTQLIAKTRSLKATLENDDNVDMHAASISYNDAVWEFYQILRKKSYIRKQGISTAISRSGMFPPPTHADDNDDDSRSGGGDGVHEYDDDYWDNPYGDSPKRGDYDHEEEAS